MDARTLIWEAVWEANERLLSLRDADVNLRVLGSDFHQYDMGPPLAESQLSRFETSNGIILPEDYRRFLATLGNGGAGPFYGLKPLHAYELDLSKPFLLTSAMYLACAPEGRESLTESTGHRGILEICHEGSGAHAYLVVNGPAYGTIWRGREHLEPTDLSFIEWYRKWVDRAMCLVENERFVSQLRIGMSSAEVRAIAEGDWQTRPKHRSSTRYFEAPEIPAKLELDPQDRVIRIRPWDFL